MTTPIRLAILWHQHQPYYKHDGEYLLPWTRLHGTKDYLDMALALEEFPDVHATINVVPSLLLQLHDYVANGATDSVLRISRRAASSLNIEEKNHILNQFFLCNVDRMVLPYPRYAELYQATLEHNRQEVLEQYTDQDWLDLQVWYALTWVGEHARTEEPYVSLLKKERHFTEDEKQRLLDASLMILSNVIPSYQRLADSGQVELSVTPFYHPILPILCDSYSALEAMPNATLPTNRIAWPEDAKLQIERGITFFNEMIGHRPKGMWPSEGSISTAALELIREGGLNWTASDEEILRRTLGTEGSPLSHCFPWRMQTPNGPIRLVFRDRELSDSIGFVYATMDPEEAAQDFITKVLDRRERVLASYGEDGLNNALLPVILDGENCWEYYQLNGQPFLRALYRLLSEHELIRTVTINEGLEEISDTPERTLGRIAAGSWIGGNFKIWIGHEEDNLAWDLLADARTHLLAARGNITEEHFHRAYEEILMAEGSDWFWWYGDENTAANENDFDRLFRKHLYNVYRLMGLPVPERLDRPIHRTDHMPQIVSASGEITPVLTGKRESAEDWKVAGHIRLTTHGGAMHRGEITERQLLFGTDGQNLYFRYEPDTLPGPQTGVRIILRNDRTVEMGYRDGKIFVAGEQIASLSGIEMQANETLDVKIDWHMISDTFPERFEIVIEMYEDGALTERVPRDGVVELYAQNLRLTL